jgi:hypothetical protein
MTMDIVAWARRTRGGLREDQIKAKLRRAGCPVDEIDDPFYLDQPLPTQPARLDIEHMPELKKAVHSLMDGSQFVVLSLGHFGVHRIWDWVATHLARKGASIRELENNKSWDFKTDPGAGYEIARLVEDMSNRLRTENARAARAASGRLGPRQKLADDAVMRRAKRLWSDPSLSAKDVALEMNIGVATLYRHLGAKVEAEQEAAIAAQKQTKKTTR